MTPDVFADYESLSRFAANWLIECLRERPEALFCLATGATPVLTYSLLAERLADERKLAERMRVVKLDEWGGLDMDDPATCEQSLRATLIDPLGLGDRYVSFDSAAADPQAECDRVARWLVEHGPIDICVLGLGINGHLGFNEPASYLRPHAHVADLSPDSLAHSMLQNALSRPKYGLTLGMADIFQARQIRLLVSGQAKREPLRRLLAGQIATEFPASLLALHADVRIWCDSAACSAAN
jgi:galactosamine-6-phosphate isomerase